MPKSFINILQVLREMAGNNRQRTLYSTIYHFGFGVVIETTNGLNVRHRHRRVGKLHRKSESALRAKAYLDRRIKNATIETGLACFARGETTIDPETDFVLLVNSYDEKRFNRVFYQLFASNTLRRKKRIMAEKILALKREDLTPQTFFESGKNPVDLTRSLNEDPKKAPGMLASIKGFLMERYIAQLLSDYVQPSFVLTRNQFTNDAGKVRDSDVVMACPKSYFHKALLYIGDNEDVTIFKKH